MEERWTRVMRRVQSPWLTRNIFSSLIQAHKCLYDSSDNDSVNGVTQLSFAFFLGGEARNVQSGASDWLSASRLKDPLMCRKPMKDNGRKMYCDKTPQVFLWITEEESVSLITSKLELMRGIQQLLMLDHPTAAGRYIENLSAWPAVVREVRQEVSDANTSLRTLGRMRLRPTVDPEFDHVSPLLLTHRSTARAFWAFHSPSLPFFSPFRFYS